MLFVTSLAWLLPVEEVRRPLHQLHPARGARRFRFSDYCYEELRGPHPPDGALQHRQRRGDPRHDPHDYGRPSEGTFLKFCYECSHYCCVVAAMRTEKK